MTKTFHFYEKKLGSDCHLHSVDLGSLSNSVGCLNTLGGYDLDLHNFYISFHSYIVVQYIHTANS